MDMNVGETTTRMILPGVNASNSLIITRSGKGTDVGGKLGKVGFSFNMSLNKSEGLGSGVRALIELGMIELVGKLTGTPYWKCLEIEKTNPVMIEQAREWYDGMKPEDRVKLVQRKLAGMGFYQGQVDGNVTRDLASVIGKYQAENGLIADGRINFDLYYSLLDADQPLASDPTAGPSAPVLTAAQRPAGAVGPMTVKLDSDRGPRPNYKPKEFLQARVSLSSDGILYCYYRDNAGTIARIFPNRFHPDAFVRAGQPFSLPPDGSPFRIRFDKSGQEQVVCYASDKDLPIPANLKGADLTPLKVVSIDEISVAFKKSNPNVAEAKLDIVVK
jgi:peptidoglycan hydrolase-like protein with peptidoglycan-binding domain